MMRHLSLILMGISISLPVLAQEMPPEKTEVWEPIPEKVEVSKAGIPSDAIVLFDGNDLSAWESSKGENPAWLVQDGSVTVIKGAGGIRTREAFGSCQLHIEWRSPQVIVGEGQGRGNSGVFFMGRYEVQVLDSYESRTYSNGQAGSVYKQYIPQVNACKAPGEWQSYDIIFTAPEFKDNGELAKPAFLTVFHNGVMIHNHVELKGTTVYKGYPSYEQHESELPLGLQDHGNPVSFRNIWIRKL